MLQDAYLFIYSLANCTYGFWIKANLLEKEIKETKIIFLWWNHNNLYEISYIPFF